MSGRLERWLDEEVALLREFDSDLTSERESEYRETMGRTLYAAQLKLADDFDAFARVAHLPELGDRVLTHLRSISDGARNRGLREFFRRHW